MDGTMSWELFLQYADDFLEVSDSLGDGWVFRGDRSVIGSAYLVKLKDCASCQTSESVHDFEEPELEKLMNDKSELPKEAKTNDTTIQNLISSSAWHIVYNPSYAIPVLYFNHRESTGKLMSLEQVWKNADPNLQASLKSGCWQTLTQAEHLVERTPFFMLHPCGTNRLTSLTSNNPVVTWLSSVSPAAGLSLHPKYGSLV